MPNCLETSIKTNQILLLIEFPIKDVKYILKNRFGHDNLIKSKREIKLISKELNVAKHIDTLK